MASFQTYATVAGTAAAQDLPTAAAALLVEGTFTAERVRIYVETAPIRFTLDGTAPVAATTGEVANPEDVIELFGDEVITFKFINETGTASSLKCQGARGWRGEA